METMTVIQQNRGVRANEIPDLFAFQCSPEFTLALEARVRDQTEFDQTVVHAFHGRHPGVAIARRRAMESVDWEFPGFITEVPKVAGLSHSLARGYAVPKRGKLGDQWREELVRLAQRPRFAPLFQLHEVPQGVYDPDIGQWVTWVIAFERIGNEATAAFLACSVNPFAEGVAVPSALLPCPLSRFVAAYEASQARRAVARRAGRSDAR